MKNMKELFISLLAGIILIGCISSSTKPYLLNDDKYVEYVCKLPSPDGKISLYKYWIKYPQAHWGHTRYTILPATKTFATSSDYFLFSDTLYGYELRVGAATPFYLIALRLANSHPRN
jgi:hypothetical protein